MLADKVVPGSHLRCDSRNDGFCMEHLRLAKQRSTIKRYRQHEHAHHWWHHRRRKRNVLIVRATNIGSKKTTITNVLVFSYTNIWQRFRRRPAWTAVFNNVGNNFPVPYVIDVGHDFMSKADQADLVSRIRDTYFYAGIAHSSAKKPVMVRVKYTEPKQRN